MNSSQLIERLNEFYDKLGTDKKYSFLIKGKWGIGKTHTYNEFSKEKEESHYCSLFGISALRELEKILLKENVFPSFEKANSKKEAKVLNGILNGLIKDLSGFKNTVDAISPNNILEMLTLNNLEYAPKSLVCFDDLERCKIPMEDLMGFIERLKQKTNVIILCNEDEIKEEAEEVYKTYKEKVIDFTYALEEVEDEVVLGKLASDLKISGDMGQMILEKFKKYSQDNLRVLEKFIHLYKELSLDLINESNERIIVEQLLKSCFYVVCEENLNLFEKFQNGDKKKHFSEELLSDIRGREPKKLGKYKVEETSKKTENKYWVIYGIAESETEEEIEKYYLGNKESLGKITRTFKIEARRIEDFIENRVKLYFLLDLKGVTDLVTDIEEFIEKIDEKSYPSLRKLMRFYSMYIYLCQKIKREIKNPRIAKLERGLLFFYENEYQWVGELESEWFFIKDEKELAEIFKEKTEKLKVKFKDKKKEEVEGLVEIYLEKKMYAELSSEVSKLDKIPQIIFEYLENSFQRAIDENEWNLWHRIVDNLSVEEKEKLVDLIKKMEIEDQFARHRIDQFCKNKNLNVKLT